MGFFSFIGSVYDLDTLDTRFTTPSAVPYAAKIANDRNDKRDSNNSATGRSLPTNPSKWGTPEFFLYYLVFLIAVPYMFWVPYSVSRRMFAVAASQNASRVLIARVS